MKVVQVTLSLKTVPTEIRRTPAPTWARGVVPTNDPERAEQCLGLVVVERSEPALNDALQTLAPSVQPALSPPLRGQATAPTRGVRI